MNNPMISKNKSYFRTTCQPYVYVNILFLKLNMRGVNEILNIK